MEKTFLLDLLAHWGDLIEQIKKICHIHFKVLTEAVFCCGVTEKLRGYLARDRVCKRVTEVKCSYKPSTCLL